MLLVDYPFSLRKRQIYDFCCKFDYPFELDPKMPQKKNHKFEDKIKILKQNEQRVNNEMIEVLGTAHPTPLEREQPEPPKKVRRSETMPNLKRRPKLQALSQANSLPGINSTAQSFDCQEHCGQGTYSLKIPTQTRTRSCSQSSAHPYSRSGTPSGNNRYESRSQMVSPMNMSTQSINGQYYSG